MKTIPFVDLKAQYHAHRSEIDHAINGVLENTAFIGGAAVEQFEQEFAAYCSAKHAIGLNSGTAAIHFALRALGIGPGDEVIVPVNSFMATAAGVAHTGATPVFVDHDPQTYLIDLKKAEAAITKKTKAIIPVHLYGQPVDMDAVMAMAKKHKLAVVEDCAQAHGATWKGKHVGTFGAAGCFSFYPGKNLGAYGDAGAVITNNDTLARTIKLLREHGSPKKYHHEIVGYNDRLDGIQAAVLKVKLKHLDQWTAQRIANAERYTDLLQDTELGLPITQDHARHVWHLYVVRVKDREAMQKHLTQRGISTQIHYPIPLHLVGAFEHRHIKKGTYPVAEQYSNEIVSLPMYPELTSEQIEQVVQAIKEF